MTTVPTIEAGGEPEHKPRWDKRLVALISAITSLIVAVSGLLAILLR